MLPRLSSRIKGKGDMEGKEGRVRARVQGGRRGKNRLEREKEIGNHTAKYCAS